MVENESLYSLQGLVPSVVSDGCSRYYKGSLKDTRMIPNTARAGAPSKPIAAYATKSLTNELEDRKI